MIILQEAEGSEFEIGGLILHLGQANSVYYSTFVLEYIVPGNILARGLVLTYQNVFWCKYT